MDQYQRGRSPSTGQAHRPSSTQHSRSASQHSAFTQQANARGFDPTLQQPAINLDGTAQQHFNGNNSALAAQSAAGQQQFLSPQNAQHLGPYPTSQQQQGDFTGLDLQNAAFDQPFDPSLVNDFSFNTPGAADDNLSSQGVDMATMTMNPTSAPSSDLSFQPQHHDPFNQYSNNPSLSQHQSSDPASRHQSLSPSSAGLPFGQAGREWAAMTGAAFHGHRRNQSDAYSDISSHHSPYVDALDSFDATSGRSPMLNGQPDPSLPDQLGMGTFTLSDSLSNMQRISPGQSQNASPRISPQNSAFNGNGFDHVDFDANGMIVGPNDGLGLYPNSQMPEQFPVMGQQGDLDPAQHLDAPEINIQFAPERQPSFNEAGQSGQDFEALSPPARGSSRPRGRAISDPYSNNMRRSASPGLSGPVASNDQGRNRNSSLSVHSTHSRQSSVSRASSPATHLNGVQKSRDRASSAGALPAQRQKLIDLVEANNFDLEGVSATVPYGGDGGSRRTQKHPATFECSLCPKRFTRAYNLRSHLRTHTDERPFVCTLCGKAFARQHDRKRHESLHSGVKKFVCNGLLTVDAKTGEQKTWGCGRRFARADALGRHFRSEAGRACIKPLLDEEARERRAAMIEQHSQEMMNSTAGMQPNMMPTAAAPQMGMPMGGAEQVDVSNITLPAALLAQYPALAGIQWDALPAGDEGPEDDELGMEASGRSDYDASSGAEDGLSGAEEWMPQMGNMNLAKQQQQQQQAVQAGNWGGGGYN